MRHFFHWFFFFFNIYLFLERGEEREINISVWEECLSVASHKAPTGDLAYNSGWELNQWLATFGSVGQHSVHWATPARAPVSAFKGRNFSFYFPSIFLTFSFLIMFDVPMVNSYLQELKATCRSRLYYVGTRILRLEVIKQAEQQLLRETTALASPFFDMDNWHFSQFLCNV